MRLERVIVVCLILGGAAFSSSAQFSQTSSVADGMGRRSSSGSFIHFGAGGQPGGIATSQGGGYFNQAGFLNTFFLKPDIDTNSNGVPDEADWDNDGDLLSDVSELQGLLFNPATPTNPNLRDTDANGVSDYDEMVAGTDPTNPDAAFKLIRIARAGGGQEVGWVARGGRTYVVRARTNLLFANSIPIATNTAVGGTPPWFVVTNAVTDVTSAHGEFYTIDVKPE